MMASLNSSDRRINQEVESILSKHYLTSHYISIHSDAHMIVGYNKMMYLIFLRIPSWCGFRQCVTSASSGCWKKVHTQDRERHWYGGFGSGSSDCQPLQRSYGIQGKRNGFPQTSELHCGAEERLSSWKLCHIHTQRPEHPNGCFCGSSRKLGCWTPGHKFHKHSQWLHEGISCALSNRLAC